MKLKVLTLKDPEMSWEILLWYMDLTASTLRDVRQKKEKLKNVASIYAVKVPLLPGSV